MLGSRTRSLSREGPPLIVIAIVVVPKAVVKRREKIMIKTVAIVLFGLALGSAAQAMPPAPVPQLDSIITQARMGCGAGMVMVNGACVARTTIRHARRCARWNGGVCAHYY